MFWALSDCPSSSKLHLIYWFGAILQIILSSQQKGKTPRASDIKQSKTAITVSQRQTLPLDLNFLYNQN